MPSSEASAIPGPPTTYSRRYHCPHKPHPNKSCFYGKYHIVFERLLTDRELREFTALVDPVCWDGMLGWWHPEKMVELMQELTGARTILVEEHIAY